jgi:iron(III) transport system permease protein
MALVNVNTTMKRLLWRPGQSVWIGGVVLLAVGLVTLTPIAFVIVNSFNSARPGQPWRFGVLGWQEAFESPRTLNAIGYSFLLNLRALIGIAVAFVVSWVLIRVRIPFRRVIESLLWIAYFLPSLPIALSWILLLDPNYGLINRLIQPFGLTLSIYSIYGIMWVHLTLSTIPVMVILLTPVLRRTEASLEEAARICGAGPWQTFRRVLVPVMMPSILAVLLAGLIRGLEAFQIELLLGQPVGIYVYATRVYDLIQWDPPLFPQAMALSTLFLGILFIFAVLYQRFTGKRGFATISGRGVSFRPIYIGWQRYLISALLLAFAAVGVLLPMVTLIIGSFMKLFGHFDIVNPFSTQHWELVLTDPVFLSATTNSFVLGTGAAGFGLAIYFLLGYALTRIPMTGKATINLLVWLPWAVPGLLLGLAFLWLFLSVPLFSGLYGSYIGLIAVLVIKEMPIGVHMARTAFTQIGEDLEHAAKVSGAGWLYTYRRIVLPLVAPMLVSVFAIVFMAAIRDISTIVLINTTATTPLSLLMMDYSLAGQMESAFIIGVILCVFGIAVAFTSRKLGIRAEG